MSLLITVVWVEMSYTSKNIWDAVIMIRIPFPKCSALNDHVCHRLRYLNTCPPVDGAVWELSVRTQSLPGGICHWEPPSASWSGSRCKLSASSSCHHACLLPCLPAIVNSDPFQTVR